MQSTLVTRLGFLLIAIACAAMIGFALYLQYYKYLNPCPLCLFQRLFIVATGVLSLLAALLVRPQLQSGRRWAVAISIVSLIGFSIAIRHTWIQISPPPNMTSCDAGLVYMMQKMPMLNVVLEVLHGTGDCTKIDWTFLGLALPEWGIVAFASMVGFALWNGWRRR